MKDEKRVENERGKEWKEKVKTRLERKREEVSGKRKSVKRGRGQ